MQFIVKIVKSDVNFRVLHSNDTGRISLCSLFALQGYQSSFRAIFSENFSSSRPFQLVATTRQTHHAPKRFVVITWVYWFLGYLEQGLMVTEISKLFFHYTKSWQFKVDLLSVFPTDFLYIFWPFHPLIRVNRILHCYRIFDFSDRTETRTNFPNAFRVLKLMGTIFVMFHWNACFYYSLSRTFGIGGNDGWVFGYCNHTNIRLYGTNIRPPSPKLVHINIRLY